MSNRIRPRNATARFAAIGNPASARLDSAVANCFPGLELDTRALEGRFFPGILFWVVSAPVAPLPGTPEHLQGLKLVYLDYELDPMLPERSDQEWVKTLLKQYAGDDGIALSQGRWYLHWLEQGGKRILCEDSAGVPLDGGKVWRFVRSLAVDMPLTIALAERGKNPPPPPIVLHGYRRRYVGDAGVIDLAFPPGEMTGAMCNPWQHDFRDCACYYWASNHPDVVLGAADTARVPDGPGGTSSADSLLWLDWLRRDRSPAGAVAAPATRAAARAAQIDHYEINRRWQELPFVIGGREVGPVYRPPAVAKAEPYASPREMIDDLRSRLAPLELTLAYQYLYAVFSLRDPAGEGGQDVPPDSMIPDLVMARQFVTMVAVSEMTHLRWGNQILWELCRAGLYPDNETYEPILSPLVKHVLASGVTVPELRPLDLHALDNFARIERPGGPLDTAYARCVATLGQDHYPHALRELAIRIDTDGALHYRKFLDVRAALGAYQGSTDTPLPYLRSIQLGTPEQARTALELLSNVLASMREAYRAEAAENFDHAQSMIDKARDAMDKFRTEGESLAARGIGIPFFSIP